MTPHCHNRPEPTAYTHHSGQVIPHRMSTECKAWATGDRATPVPILERRNCSGCRWLPRADIMRFAQITTDAQLMVALVELAGTANA